MNWSKNEITNDAGELVNAQAPVIISASRSTDIPAFYADWFVERWKKGYITWTNPFTGVPLYVSFAKTRAVVFWTKNPRPLMKHLPFLIQSVPNFYFQFTLNDYDDDGLEGIVPKLEHRIKTFRELSTKLGKERVIWRFDPLILTENIDVDTLLKRVEKIGDQLKDFTKKMVFSFADIKIYNKVANNLRKEKIPYREFTPHTMNEFAKGLKELNRRWKFNIGTCAEQIPLEQYDIEHNKCVDDDLMIKLFNHDEELMKFLGVKVRPGDLFRKRTMERSERSFKDKGQRELCGCIISKDIGQYNTCPHGCVYCYANTSKEIAQKNYSSHKSNPLFDSILGKQK